MPKITPAKINNTAIIIVLLFILLMATVIAYYNIQVKQIDRQIELTRQTSH